MKCSILFGAALAALAFGTVSANAAGLLYSFETGDSPNSVDGFAQNGRNRRFSKHYWCHCWLQLDEEFSRRN